MLVRLAAAAATSVGMITLASCGMDTSPLLGIGSVTRLIVASPGTDTTGHAITNQPTIDSLVRFAKYSRGWESSWHTLPGGEYVVELRRDTTLVGVLWLGDNYVMARRFDDNDNKIRLRPSSDEELVEIRRWLALPPIRSR